MEIWGEVKHQKSDQKVLEFLLIDIERIVIGKARTDP